MSLPNLQSLQGLSEDDQRVLREWNDTRTEGAMVLAHARVSAQAAAAPDVVAVELGDERLTYGELDARSNQLAHHLRSLGVGPEVAVGLCLERSLDLVIATLAIAKAGGACVPLDPTYPAERLKLLVEDAQLRLVATHAAHRAELAGTSVRRLVLDSDKAIAHASSGPVEVAVDPEGIAYVMYTSGSTGRPKGVMVTHRGLANALAWRQHRFPLTPDDAVLHKTAFSFDPAIWEVWAPLAFGARLVLARPGGHREPDYLVETIHRHRVTAIDVVPSQLAAMLDDPAFPRTALTRVFCGGEALSDELLQMFTANMRSELVNMYGPTETTIDATYWVARTDEQRPTPPIGRPIANTRTYVLDEHLGLVPPRSTGEIYLAGAGVARGYCGRAGLTAERFLPDPFDPTPGARMYRTGDLGRFLRDGNLEFLGRSDQQVKIRGVRIEPAEIEAVLTTQTGAREAAVVVHEPTPGNQLLIGYVVRGDEAGSVDDMRELLAQLLPEHMVPQLVEVFELPRTAGGKIDRAELRDRPFAIEGSTDPLEGTEATIAALFERLLKIQGVGRDGNFFDLGGHSLLATRLLSAISRDFGVDLTLRQIFADPTVNGIASLIDAAPPGGPARTPVKRLGLTEGPAGLLQPYMLTVDAHNPHTVFARDAVQIRGPFDPGAFERAVAAVAIRHEVLRTNYAGEGDAVRQIVRPAQPPFMPTFEYDDVVGRPGWEDRPARIAETADELLHRPLDVRHGPIARFKLLRFSPTDHVLIRLVHHVISDGPSSGLLYQDLATAYRAALADPSAPPAQLLEPLPLQFLDIASHLAAHRDSPAGAADVAYWQQRFAGLQPLALPCDLPRDVVDQERDAKTAEAGRPFVLLSPFAFAWRTDDALAPVVTAAARRENVPLLVFVLAALAEVLHGETGHADIALQTALNVRALLDADPLLGGFNSPVFVRIDLSSRPTRRELMRQVRDQFADAYAHALVIPNQIVPSHAGRVNVGYVEAGSTMAQLGDDPDPEFLRLGGQAKMPFDLRPEVTIDGDRLHAVIGYNTRLFKQETIERMCGRFIAVLRAMAEHPDAGVAGPT